MLAKNLHITHSFSKVQLLFLHMSDMIFKSKAFGLGLHLAIHFKFNYTYFIANYGTIAPHFYSDMEML